MSERALSRMMEVAKGLEILTKYWPDGDIACEHDVIYAGGQIELAVLDPVDKARLEELHWFYSDEFDSWAVFV